MKPLAQPGLPVPLPRPLSDPLGRYRWLLVFFLPLLWVGVVVSWLLPDVGKVREAARRTETQPNLKQTGLALHNYQDRNDVIPPGFIPNNFEQPAVARNPGAQGFAPRAERKNSVSPEAVALRPGGRFPELPKQKRTLRDVATTVAIGASFTLLFCAFCILPRRATNAFYLRSFRNDAATGPLRIAAQAALGPAFRLSGIRDPRRRWPPLIRHMFYVLFMVRYAHPKFMNLEASSDWKARLWRSLGAARCALIDITELTLVVREEVALASSCLGFHRVLFIGNGTRTKDEWRQVALSALGSPDMLPQCIRVAIWTNTAEGRASFKSQVRAFANGLPAAAPGLNAAAFPAAPAATDPASTATTGESWRMFLLANLIAVVIAGAFALAESRMPDAGLAWFLPGFFLGIVYNVLVFLLLLQYCAVCASLRQRLQVAAAFLMGAMYASVPLLPDLVALNGGGRSSAARARVKKPLGLARQDAHLSNERLPTAMPPSVNASSIDGSMFMHILPYLNQGDLTGQYGPTVSSWQNTPGNTAIKTYVSPLDSFGPAQQALPWSSYAALMGEFSPWGPVAAGGDNGVIARNNFYGTGSYARVRITEVTDGTGNTFVLGETGFQLPDYVRYANTSHHFPADYLSPAMYQGLSTRNGGEVMPDDY